MNAEIIAVGSEITTGDITDTNSAYLSKRLTELGINIVAQTAVPDNAKRIVAALAAAIPRSQLIIFTGGLGPTPDDLTKETLCKAIGLPLVENEESINRIKQYFARKGMEMAEANRKQALFPEKAIILPNAVGTADGCIIESGNQCIVMFPGPPYEMKKMYEDCVLPYITKKLDRVVLVKTLKVYGMGESTIADKLGDILKSTDPTVATYVGNGDIRIKITATGLSKAECIAKYEPVVSAIKELLGKVVYADEDKSISQVVVDSLSEQGKMIAVAESCTGGLVSKMITDISGASKVFEYGVSAYANRVKTEVLGVSKELLDEKGAVSAEVAEAMAEGVKKASGADIGIATTGYASGGEGVPADEVGLVYISLCDGNRVFTRKIMAGHGGSDREKVRIAAAMNCFDMARLYLSGDDDFLFSGKVITRKIEIPQEEVVLNDLVLEETKESENLTFLEKPDLENANKNRMVKGAKDFVKEEESEKPKKEKKKKGLKGFFGAILPKKGDKKSEIARKISILLCIAIFLGSGGYIADYYYKGFVNKNLTNELHDVFYTNTAEGTDGMLGRFTQLSKINPEVVGWLKIPGIKTDNPIVKSQTDTATSYKYLYKDFYGKHSSYGTLFAKFDNLFNGELSPNTTIYGHHMKDGQMFGELKKYRDLEFYKQHPTVEFTPIYSDKVVKWKVFAVMLVDTVDTPGHGKVYDYSRTNFGSDNEFLAFVDEAYQRSIIDMPVRDITPEDKILSLSTCSYEFKNARLVVMARMVRNGEDEKVDTASSVYNKDVVYPKVHKSAKNTNTTVTPYEGSSQSQVESSVNDQSSVPESPTDAQ
ncbi:MAG: competence/damage-inducible protein A [Clostridia bacterium]|nr:competence/damage-inducible protein A [Clostridia bacterium]